MSNHRVLLVLIGFLISLQLSAQSGGEVRGVVKGVSPEGKTERLAGAHVIWMKTSEGTATKVDGTFSMPLSEETDMLVIRFIGYQSDTVKYTGKPVKVTLQSGEMIEEALVVYEREATELSLIDPLNTQTMNRKELQKAASVIFPKVSKQTLLLTLRLPMPSLERDKSRCSDWTESTRRSCKT